MNMHSIESDWCRWMTLLENLNFHAIYTSSCLKTTRHDLWLKLDGNFQKGLWHSPGNDECTAWDIFCQMFSTFGKISGRKWGKSERYKCNLLVRISPVISSVFILTEVYKYISTESISIQSLLQASSLKHLYLILSWVLLLPICLSFV